MGSALRALLMALLVAIPSLILPNTSSDAAQMAALVALVAAVVTFAEYYSEYPTFLEFREAPPFNRLRFVALFLSVMFASSLTASDVHGGQTWVDAVAASATNVLDFLFSPVRLIAIAFGDVQGVFDVTAVKDKASLIFAVCLVAFVLFYSHARFIFWPIRKKAFNFWINLPLFDLTSGRDVLFRLKRNAHINLALGFLLLFVIPALIRMWMWMGAFDPTMLAVPEILIWVLCA